jgi:hypothetical protein
VATMTTLGMSPEVLKDLWSVLILVVGTLLLWAALSRAARRTRRHYEDLMRQAAQQSAEPGGADIGALDVAQKRLTVLRLVVNSARYALAIVFVLALLSQLNVQVTGLLLPAGFLGAALGVGAQNVVRDVLSGVFLLFEGQFAVGDVVAINGIAGTVEEVGLRVTKLRDDAGQLHFVPNGAITTVARYPRRSTGLLVRVPLLKTERQDEIESVVIAASRQFASLIDRSASVPVLAEGAFDDEPPTEEEHLVMEAAAEPNPASEPAADASRDEGIVTGEADVEGPVAPTPLPEAKPVGYLLWRWTVHPSRAVLWREKFPSHLAAALRRAELDQVAGGDVEVFAAPTAP